MTKVPNPNGPQFIADADYNPDRLIGYLGASLRHAVNDHPDDANLADGLATWQVYRAHEAEILTQLQALSAAHEARRGGGQKEDGGGATISEQECTYKWLLWSDHHKAWWGPNESGYRNNVRDAGQYSHAEATKNLRRDCYCCLTPELAIPVPLASLPWRELDRWVEEAVNNARATRIEYGDVNTCFEADGGTR